MFRLGPFLFQATALCATLVAEANVLDANHQHRLDALATSLHLQAPYEDLKEEARNQFLSTVELFGYKVDSSYMKHQLEVAVEELAFGFLQQAVNGDPASPKVYRVIAPPRYDHQIGITVPGGRFGFDNPDCVYRIMPVSDAYSYVVHGKRTGVGASDITLSLHNSITSKTLGLVVGKDIVVDNHGHFTITVNSSAAALPTHLQSTSDTKLLLIRHNVGDWLVESLDELEVELIRRGVFAAEAISNDTIVSTARSSLRQNIPVANFLLGKLTLSMPVNAMAQPSQSAGMGLATQALVLSHYSLRQTEAMVLTVEAGPSTYWNLGVYSLWMVTENPRDRLVTLNNHQAIANNNGSYTFVLSATDPDIHNWLNTSEQGVGTIVARFQGLPLGGSALNHIRIWTHLSNLEDLHMILPSDVLYVSPQQRASQMAARARGYDRLYSFNSPYVPYAGSLQCKAVSESALPTLWMAGGPYCQSAVQ
ncbi:hypothetical protein HIM_09778 [Hirsutella minnesotensis 3608]|uniref:DUF1214 domain-containing protein n=1 Tax=Hirsutella minnesotensis 3608 TaxID=1043627 RepID=A0A0F8A2X1_9HYPO|nr:hypothetical protein HIM_09778 [Hirsutella minnesotensis 3608]